MSLVINTNNSSLNAQRQLLHSGEDLDKASARLSSGKRINSAADDAAGLALSNRMQSQVRGLNQAIRNANDGVSLIQVAEGALNETTNLLQRVRELSIQASNGIYGDSDRSTLNAEVQQLISQVDFIAKNTQFNGRAVLQGNHQAIDLQIGAEANQTVSLKIPAMDASSLGMASFSGDLIGSQMEIDGAGGLTNALAAGAIKINGKAIPAVDTGTTLEDFLASLNDSLVGVEASTQLNMTADKIGDGRLQGSQALTINGVDLSGDSVSFSVNNTLSLQELADKITANSNGLLQGGIDDSGKLTIASDSMATITLVDSSSGAASGVSPGINSDPDVAAIVQALQTYWIAEAENMISNFYGMTGDGRDLTLNLQTVANGQSDGPFGALASVDPNTFTLNIDMADFGGVALPNGPNVGGWLYGDRIITHEMVHAVMATRMNLGALPGWFVEGTAEFIHGVDERVELDIQSGALDTLGEFQTEFTNAQAPGSPSAVGYSVGYVAIKMLHADIIANAGAGSGGIKILFDQLEAGASLDQAITTLNGLGQTSYTNLAAFNTAVSTGGFNFMNTQLNFDGAVGVESDTGSIQGSDYGFAAKNAIDIIPNTAHQAPQYFNLIIPSEYGGGSKSVDAQLVLRSRSGEAINITQGLTGTDASLNQLGFSQVSGFSTLGKALTTAAQNTAMEKGDLIINGVTIDAALAGAGLQGKIDAINAASDETGVVASSLAKTTYQTNSSAEIEWVATNAIGALANDTIGINGIGIAITAGDSATTVAAAINNLTSVHGAKAYVDDTDHLHLFSTEPLNLSQATSYFTDIGISQNVLSTGSLEIRGQEVSLSNIYDLSAIAKDINAVQGQTGVFARVNDNGELALESGGSFSLALGDNNGLKTFQALGIGVSLAASGSGLIDSDGDHLLEDESIQVLARLKLTSGQGNNIQIQLSDNGKTVTGLLEQNKLAGVSSGSSLSGLNVLSIAAAQKAVGTVDNALKTINDTRSELGAVNNRLDFTIANLSSISEKTSAALSRIVDADFAVEAAKLSRAQVLQKAAQSMLSQANSSPQIVLSLLR